MTKETGAWMPMYWSDYFGDTIHLSTEEHGAYLILIGMYWLRGGPIPDDDRELAIATKTTPKKWKKIREKLSQMFVIEGGVWRHKRLDYEILRSSGRLKSARANGRAGGLAKSKLTTTTSTERKKEPPPVGPPPSEDGGTPTASAQPSLPNCEPKPPRGTRLPADWQPSAQDLAYARDRGFDEAQVLDIVENFRDHWTNGTGRGKTHVDWSRTWKGWIRRESPRAGGAPRRDAPDGNRQGDGGLVAAARAVADAFSDPSRPRPRPYWRDD